MNVAKLIEALEKIEDKTLPVFCQDGMDPSDPTEILYVEFQAKGFDYPETGVIYLS